VFDIPYMVQLVIPIVYTSIVWHEGKIAVAAISASSIFYIYSRGVEGQQCVKRFIEVYTP
jgi:hypothetical protein